jgi:PAS domain S-box-containing protein
MNQGFEELSEEDLEPTTTLPPRWYLRWKAFTLTKTAWLLQSALIGGLVTTVFAIGFNILPFFLLIPSAALLTLLLFFSFRSYHELKEQVETLSREVVQTSEQYQVLTTNLAAAIIIRDGTGNLLFCSPYTEVLTGYSRQEIYQQGDAIFNQIIHEDDQELYRRAQKVAAYGEAFQYRFRFFHKSGLEMWAESRTVPILDDAGVVTSSLSVLIDITGTALYQKQVEEMNKDSQDFSYMISHDLKAPIATIKGMLNVLQEENGAMLGPDASEAVIHIENATRRLDQLVNAVLEYSRISNTGAEREPISLSKVLKDITTDFGPALKAHQAIFNISPNQPEVLGEELRIYQIFSNLVGNAIKYSSNERTLTIAITTTSSPGSRWVTVSVKDNGIGIPSEKQSAVFRPFYRAHRDYPEGAGVGLACVKKMVEKLGGEISLTSEANVGSEFTIKFVRAG